MEPKIAQRKPKETSEEAKGDLRRAKIAPQSPKMCSKRGQDGPRERQDGPKGALRGATWPPRWAKIAQRGAQDDQKVKKKSSKVQNEKC